MSNLTLRIEDATGTTKILQGKSDWQYSELLRHLQTMFGGTELTVMYGNKYIGPNSQNLTLQQLNITNNSVIRVVSVQRPQNPNPPAPEQPPVQAPQQISIVIEDNEGTKRTIQVPPNLQFKHLYERFLQIFGNQELTIIKGNKYLSLTSNGEIDLQTLGIGNNSTIKVMKQMVGGFIKSEN
ncbi:unnamed protein product [Blepharisma stoltei]|uniref:Ubiquitin-like domain-containing protein n=1 Tax=Blepharisma stoltei TaxID=1481888 RepID=A0AAU9IXN2_9CILI|nr:unnamed protein product [Blepharisma stoltei]CAG9324177.1 unnamed protein product [Blepharisma stoltei]